MSVEIRPAKPREKVEQIKGYNSLLNKIAWNDILNQKGFISVVEVNL